MFHHYYFMMKPQGQEYFRKSCANLSYDDWLIWEPVYDWDDCDDCVILQL